MLMPKRTKYRKSHRLTYDGVARGNTTLTKGEFGLVACEGAWIKSRRRFFILRRRIIFP